MSEVIFVERWITFEFTANQWTIQMWKDRLPDQRRYYRLKILVPAELLGPEIVGEVDGA